MKTIREIANELGVDKQKVYRFIKQNHINEAHHEALQRSGVKYYDEAAETLIKQGFSDETASSEAHHEAHHEAHQNRINEAVFDAVIEMLQKELEIKNEQIKELNERLSECSAALLAAQQTTQAAQVLHAGTIQKEIASGESGVDKVSDCSNCLAGARKSTFILPAHKGRRCESAFALLSHQKVTKRLPYR